MGAPNPSSLLFPRSIMHNLINVGYFKLMMLSAHLSISAMNVSDSKQKKSALISVLTVEVMVVVMVGGCRLKCWNHSGGLQAGSHQHYIIQLEWLSGLRFSGDLSRSSVCFGPVSLHSAVFCWILIPFYSIVQSYFPLHTQWFSDPTGWQFCVFRHYILFMLFLFFFFFPSRHHGPPAPWGSGSQSYLKEIDSSRLGSLKGGPTASGWRASSTRRASWQPWDRYTWHRATYLFTHCWGGEQMARRGTQCGRHTTIYTHTYKPPHRHMHILYTHRHFTSNEFQFILMWESEYYQGM